MTNIKERVLQIAEMKGVVKTEFFKELGLSYANFKGVQKTTALGSDAVVKILAMYPEVSADWLLTNNGSMLRSTNEISFARENAQVTDLETEKLKHSFVSALEEVISAQQKTICSLEITIDALKRVMESSDKKKKNKKK